VIRIPRFKSNFRVYAAPPDHVFFLGNGSYQILKGKLTCSLAPLINGKNSVQQIARKLKNKISDFDVDCGLLLLEDEGYITFANNHWRILPANRKSSATDITVVLVDDYLSKGLSEFNRKVLDQNKTWTIAKLVGDIFWVGPAFGTDAACYECLARRLSENFQVESLIQKIRGVQRCIDQSPIPKSIRDSALKWAKAEIKKKNQALQTLNLREMKVEKHSIPRFDSCSCKGSQQKFRQNISPLTGVVHQIHILNSKGPAYFCAASHLFVPPKTEQDLFQKVYRQRSAGKGTTLEAAKMGAFCEALERYSGVFRKEDAAINATYKELGHSAIHPQGCLNFSEKQYKNRDTWNRTNSEQDWIPARFDETQKIDWTPIWSLTNQENKYIPTAYCFYGYPQSPETKFCLADSNGNAAGNTIDDAILSGFMELVERDSIALWWYNRLCRPAVNSDSFDLPYIKALQKYYRKLNREFWVLDITSDFNIPAFAAISSDPKNEIIMGFGANFDPSAALIHAVTEMNQFLPPRNFENVQWKSPNLDFLKPNSELPAKNLQDYEKFDNPYVDVCVTLAKERGMETFVLNQTRSDVGLPVVKVIVPGMRQFWPRFGKGRLYDVPVQMGWLKKALTENQLNPDRLLI
jgi:bacteriocin biosynthesis cyclodehydratase domain-containing protein